MSIQRRWFLTAAGSAFLASLSGVLNAATKSTKRKRSGDPAEDARLIFDDFKLGFGNITAAQEKVCKDVLETTYLARFKERYPALSDKEIMVLSGFANAMGSLTAGALRNEKAGKCGWKKDESAVLREEHLQRAREMLGFHMNLAIRPGKRCSASPPPATKEPEEPCPLCPV